MVLRWVPMGASTGGVGSIWLLGDLRVWFSDLTVVKRPNHTLYK